MARDCGPQRHPRFKAIRARQWVASSQLADLWSAPPDPTLDEDLTGLGGGTF